MPADLTEREFSQHANSTFRLKLQDQELELQLVEVKGYLPQDNEQQRMERFSLYFSGPSDPLLEQQIYHLAHDRMGEFDIFLVPIGKDEHGCHYEAVFNYFK